MICAHCVVWWDGFEIHRTYLQDRPGADAYATKHHGIIVELVAVGPWPTREQVIAAADRAPEASMAIYAHGGDA